jgi:acyl-coenzyme A synthetase/AMP-(fatty) acid ligase
MPDKTPPTQVIRLVWRAARWRPSDRQIWLAILAVAIVGCAEAIVVPSRRQALLCGLIAFASVGLWFTQSRQWRREREAVAVRLASLSRDDIPADVIGLVAAGKKIRAIKRYRELTGVGLREAKTVVDALCGRADLRLIRLEGGRLDRCGLSAG